jgi:hypothetical protein
MTKRDLSLVLLCLINPEFLLISLTESLFYEKSKFG